ncbi:MAG TPA: TonB-dependent receptor [Acidisarcina sp.]
MRRLVLGLLAAAVSLGGYAVGASGQSAGASQQAGSGVGASTGVKDSPGAQQGLSGVVVDSSGAAIANARILAAAAGHINGAVLATTDNAGGFRVEQREGPLAVRVEAAGFVTAAITIVQGRPVRVVLDVQAATDSVTVTAYRTPLASEDSPASTRTLTAAELNEAASPALDNRLRLAPGVELFRRSSSLVANPTSQGLSLRGLGSTAASRTLVVSDDVPLNDPYGGWIHWTEPPELSVRSIELVRGGASDLYGSSAIGGVVNLIAEQPPEVVSRQAAGGQGPDQTHSDRLTLLSSYGGKNTLDEGVLASTARRCWSALASGGLLRTDGYTLVAPDLRGPVDIPSNVHSQNGVVLIERPLRVHSHDGTPGGGLFLRGSVFNEARSNGTRLQTNATRLWRFAGGFDLPTPAPRADGNVALRLYGSEEHYRQSFSAIGAGRASESQTRFGRTPAQELGAVAHWSEPLAPALLVVIGADTHDVRATDTELSIQHGKPAGLLDTSARQRQSGAYAEALWTPPGWTVSAGGRVDHFSNFDAQQSRPPALPGALPGLGETVFNPRLGLARHILPRLAPGLVWSASAFRAYRAPTQNELYRTGQVGQETTLPNSQLRSERATGWETGLAAAGRGSTVRASYFWTQVNRPITALTLSSTPTQITDRRENLGQIESRGLSIDLETEPLRGVSLIGGYQYADATVTKFSAKTSLVGHWIPQVARNSASAQLRLSRASLGTLSLQGRISGRQYDDAANMFLLHGYFRLDAYAARHVGRRLEIFASGENLFDRSIQVGRTPVLTLGTPAVARVGVRVRIGE